MNSKYGTPLSAINEAPYTASVGGRRTSSGVKHTRSTSIKMRHSPTPSPSLDHNRRRSVTVEEGQSLHARRYSGQNGRNSPLNPNGNSDQKGGSAKSKGSWYSFLPFTGKKFVPGHKFTLSGRRLSIPYWEKPPTMAQIVARVVRMVIKPRRRYWSSMLLILLSLVGFLKVMLHFFAPQNDMSALMYRWGMEGKYAVPGMNWNKRKVDDDGLCSFVSPVEAYQTGLRRLLAEQSLKSSYNQPYRNSYAKNLTAYHEFSNTGHLLVNPDSNLHPIPQLLQLGEKRWEDMLERQSTTLGEAVAEYTRRYGRRPPKGFDLWWDFAQTHHLILPDEYDRIHMDLAPFHALPREEMRRRLKEVEDVEETFTLAFKDGKIEIEIKDQGGLSWEGTWARAVDATSLLKNFARFLPDMRATFSIHDQPQVYLSWARRNSLVELGIRGEHTSHLKETDDSRVNWQRSCPPESNFRKNPGMLEVPSLVYDPLEAADLCSNPYLMDKHGLTVTPHGPESHPKPHTSLIPLFHLAKTSVNSDILITPLDQFETATGKDPKWEKKRDERLVWRGSNTGISWMDKTVPWKKAHRFQLHAHAQNESDDEMELIVPDLSISDNGQLRMRREKATTREAAEFFYDMKLSGAPLQCNQTDGTCEEMKRKVDFAPHQSSKEMNNYKFMFDVDGNGWSARFRRLMSTNSVVLKAGIFTEWFQPHLIPWFHYIPTRLDYTDLPTILGFLRGTPSNPDGGFDEVAKALAHNGQCYVKRMFRLVDMQAYMFRLFLEYARLAADNEDDYDFYYTEDLEEGETSNPFEPQPHRGGGDIFDADPMNDNLDFLRSERAGHVARVQAEWEQSGGGKDELIVEDVNSDSGVVAGSGSGRTGYWGQPLPAGAPGAVESPTVGSGSNNNGPSDKLPPIKHTHHHSGHHHGGKQSQEAWEKVRREMLEDLPVPHPDEHDAFLEMEAKREAAREEKLRNLAREAFENGDMNAGKEDFEEEEEEFEFEEYLDGHVEHDDEFDEEEVEEDHEEGHEHGEEGEEWEEDSEADLEAEHPWGEAETKEEAEMDAFAMSI